jgi:CHASE2 domain-containing sensor protein
VSEPTERAERLARLLERANNVVGVVALLVYLVTVSLALSESGWFALVPLTSALLGVGLIHLTVRTFLAHMDLLRTQKAQEVRVSDSPH